MMAISFLRISFLLSTFYHNCVQRDWTNEGNWGGGGAFVTYSKMLKVFRLVRLQTATYSNRVNRDLHKVHSYGKNIKCEVFLRHRCLLASGQRLNMYRSPKFYLTLHLISFTAAEKTNFTTRSFRSFSFPFPGLSTLCRILQSHWHRSLFIRVN